MFGACRRHRHSATSMPVSSGSSVTRSFILGWDCGPRRQHVASAATENRNLAVSAGISPCSISSAITVNASALALNFCLLWSCAVCRYACQGGQSSDHSVSRGKREKRPVKSSRSAVPAGGAGSPPCLRACPSVPPPLRPHPLRSGPRPRCRSWSRTPSRPAPSPGGFRSARR